MVFSADDKVLIKSLYQFSSRLPETLLQKDGNTTSTFDIGSFHFLD